MLYVVTMLFVILLPVSTLASTSTKSPPNTERPPSSSFDLICNLENTLSDVVGFHSEQFGKASFTTRRFRIDLGSERWCESDCVETSPLYRVDDRDIVFAASGSPGVTDSIEMVSRESGQFTERIRIFSQVDPLKIEVFMTKGVCLRAPFTGFPAKRF